VELPGFACALLVAGLLAGFLGGLIGAGGGHGAFPSVDVQRLYTLIASITKSPEMKQFIEEAGNEPIGATPAETAGIVRREARFMGKLIKAKNIRLD
jgi:hypothetical protein